MVRAVCIGAEDDIELRRTEIVDAIREVDDGSGWWCSPTCSAARAVEPRDLDHGSARIEVIAGVNLPMLIKLASVRQNEPLRDAVTAAQEAGRKYINVASCSTETGPEQPTSHHRQPARPAPRAAAKFVRTAETFEARRR